MVLKILFTSTFYPPYHIGGDAVHVKYLAEELAKRGNEVHVIHSISAYNLKRGALKNPEKEDSHPNLHVHPVQSRFDFFDPLMAYTTGRTRFFKRNFLSLLKDIHPDIVHHHNISLLGHEILNSNFSGPSLYTSHDYWLICPKSSLFKDGKICTKKSCATCQLKSMRPPQLWRFQKSFKKAISNIDLLICPSNFVRGRITQELDIESITLPNFAPIPPSIFSPVIYSNYFLFIGALEKHKGILLLLEVFRELRTKIDAKLIIVGAGSLAGYIRDFIARNCLESKIVLLDFTTNIQELYALYKNSLALLVPSTCPENAPLVALEALSVGTPVLGSNNGGLPEILMKVNKDFIFNDVEALKNLLINFPGKDAYSKQVIQSYENNFSPKAYIDRYLAKLQQIN
jgi:glycosyltransferase involved in cell wall biosynthesis